MPEALMNVLMSNCCEEVMNQFIEVGESLDHDWFTQYFEEEFRVFMWAGL